MIKFFRKIRQSLLSENKFSKYLIYAIGEIVLVVIGILIALQINNANEEKKQRLEEYRILSDLKIDIVNDTLQLHNYIQNTIKWDSALWSILDILALEQDHDIQNFVKLSVENMLFYSYFNTNSGTFDESIASGTIKYISNDSLRQHIFNYYRDVKANLNDNSTRDANRQAIDILSEKVLASKEAMNNAGIKSRAPRLDMNALGKDVEFISTIAKKIGDHTVQRRSWHRYSKNAKTILTSINRELKNF